MRHKNVKTNVRPQDTRRMGDAPDLGRVARMPGTGIPNKGRRRRRKTTGSPRTFGDKRRTRKHEASRFAYKLWISLILLAACASIAFGWISWLNSQADRKLIAQNLPPAGAMPALQITDFPPPSEGEALRIFQNALAADDEDALRKYVRDTPEVAPGEILAFFAASPQRDGHFVAHSWIGSSDTERLQIQVLRVIFDKDGSRNTRLAMLVPDDTGTWKLDFPAYARWCDPPIPLIDTRDGHPGGTVRVEIADDAYHNGPFADDRTWKCIAFGSTDSQSHGYGYIRIGSPQFRALQAILALNGRSPLATLEIERHPEAEPRQFVITRVIANGWIHTGPAYDTAFE